MSKRTYARTKFCSAEILSRFEPTSRDSDVFVATSSKCGQTWLTTLLYHLKTKAKFPDLQNKGLFAVVPWLEVPTDFLQKPKPLSYNVEQRVSELDATEDPRIFKMHVVWEDIPRTDKAKVITISRDIRDVAYSMYKHSAGVQLHLEGKDHVPDFDEYFHDIWLKTAFYFPHLKSFWNHRDDPNLLWLVYEDMLEDPVSHAKRIVEFLNWEISEDELIRAVELSSFGSMKQSEETILQFGDAFQGTFIREGGVGKNCAKLTPQMEEAVLKKLSQEVPPEAADFVLSDKVTANAKAIRATTATQSKEQ